MNFCDLTHFFRLNSFVKISNASRANYIHSDRCVIIGNSDLLFLLAAQTLTSLGDYHEQFTPSIYFLREIFKF